MRLLLDKSKKKERQYLEYTPDYTDNTHKELYTQISIDRNFLQDVSNENNFFFDENFLSKEAQKFVDEFYNKLEKIIFDRFSKKQCSLIIYYVRMNLQLEDISAITEKSFQNSWKMLNKDIIGKLKRIIYRSAELKKFITTSCPNEMKPFMIKWFKNVSESEVYEKRCPVCGFKIISDMKFYHHFLPYEKNQIFLYVGKKNRGLTLYKKHNEFIKQQKKILKKYFKENVYCKSSLNEFLVSDRPKEFVMNELWIIHVKGKPKEYLWEFDDSFVKK